MLIRWAVLSSIMFVNFASASYAHPDEVQLPGSCYEQGESHESCVMDMQYSKMMNKVLAIFSQEEDRPVVMSMEDRETFLDHIRNIKNSQQPPLRSFHGKEEACKEAFAPFFTHIKNQVGAEFSSAPLQLQTFCHIISTPAYQSYAKYIPSPWTLAISLAVGALVYRLMPGHKLSLAAAATGVVGAGMVAADLGTCHCSGGAAQGRLCQKKLQSFSILVAANLCVWFENKRETLRNSFYAVAAFLGFYLQQ